MKTDKALPTYPLSANPTKWPHILYSNNSLTFVGLALKGLRNVKRKQLKSKSNEINRAINYIVTENITLISRLLKAAGCVVAKKLDFKTKLAKETKIV